MKKAPKEKLPEPVMNGEPVIDPNVFLDKPQMARLLQVSIGTVNNRVADGTLAHLKLGRRILFHRETCLAQLLRAQRGGVA
jgi:excisionase family DNA binding protein